VKTKSVAVGVCRLFSGALMAQAELKNGYRQAAKRHSDLSKYEQTYLLRR
jgi:hypothetical protein